MSDPLQLISVFSGYLNNYPAKSVLKVISSGTMKWKWRAEMYFDDKYAADHGLTQNKLWCLSGEDEHDSITEAHWFGKRFLSDQGWEFLKEVQ